MNFEIDPPTFDLDGFEAPLLSCDQDLAEWSLLLPPVSHAEESSIVIEVVATETTQYFELKESIMSLIPELV